MTIKLEELNVITGVPFTMDFEYLEESSLSPEEQEKARFLKNLAGLLIIAAWISTGIFLIVTVLVTSVAFVRYWRRHSLRRRVRDGCLLGGHVHRTKVVPVPEKRYT